MMKVSVSYKVWALDDRGKVTTCTSKPLSRKSRLAPVDLEQIAEEMGDG